MVTTMAAKIGWKQELANLEQRGSCMVWEVNMGVWPRLDFENSMLFNCLGYNFNIYGAFEFYAIPLLIYDVMYDSTIIP